MSALLVAVGAGLICLVLMDVFFTVLFPSSGRGPIRKPLSRLVWSGFRRTARRLGDGRRPGLLAFSGPALITVTLLVWGVLLVTGWAFVAKPALGHTITSGAARTDTSWATAFFYSTGVLTTLGPGNFEPSTGAYRLLEVAESATGVVSVSMVLTYFLSVYNAVTARKTFASILYHRSRGTGDAAVLLGALSTDGKLSDTRNYLTSIGDSMIHMFQTHRSYPVLRYFHFRQARYSLPRILLVALDAASLLEAILGAEGEARAISTAAAAELRGGAGEMLSELSSAAGQSGPADARRTEEWRDRYRNALDTLRTAGITLPERASGSADRYIELRSRWDLALRAMAEEMAYPWTEIDRSCRPTAAGLPR